MKLHLGCGGKHIEGYVNVDARDLPGVDIVDDIRTLEKFEQGSCELIYACHVLEHVGRTEYNQVLDKWYGLLKTPGVLMLSVPDIEAVFNHYNKYRDLRALRGFLWGGQTYAQNYHYCGWDFETMRSDLMSVGFSRVERYDWRDTEHSHMDDFSQAYLPHMDKENGMLMSLNVKAFKD